MSYIDLDGLDPLGLVTHYVMECRGKGLILPYNDHELIVSWLGASESVDTLLLVLADLLPPYFEKKTTSNRPRSLHGIHRSVLKTLKNHAMRAPSR